VTTIVGGRFNPLVGNVSDEDDDDQAGERADSGLCMEILLFAVALVRVLCCSLSGLLINIAKAAARLPAFLTAVSHCCMIPMMPVLSKKKARRGTLQYISKFHNFAMQ
jgi:hypothetical protein